MPAAELETTPSSSVLSSSSFLDRLVQMRRGKIVCRPSCTSCLVPAPQENPGFQSEGAPVQVLRWRGPCGREQRPTG